MITNTIEQMNNIWIVDLEAVESRYTGQWKHHFPDLIRKLGFGEYNVSVIEGPTDIPEATTPGAFLNFGGTNIYKSAQMTMIGRLFCDNEVKAGDHFIYTDAWNPSIIQLKYMSQLLEIPIKIHGLWHAGNYDPNDFLGRLIKNEGVKSMIFDASDDSGFYNSQEWLLDWLTSQGIAPGKDGLYTEEAIEEFNRIKEETITTVGRNPQFGSVKTHFAKWYAKKLMENKGALIPPPSLKTPPRTLDYILQGEDGGNNNENTNNKETKEEESSGGGFFNFKPNINPFSNEPMSGGGGINFGN